MLETRFRVLIADYQAPRRVCVFITAVPITKLFAWGEGDSEDMCYERRRSEAFVD